MIINKIKPERYQKMIDENEPHILIDVRRLDEFEERHIKGSKLLPLHMIEENIEHLFPNKEAVYILYCRSGIRSQDALKLMLHLGYKHVYDLGGIIHYPYEIVKK